MGDEEASSDKRFARVAWDPKFKSMPMKERKVKIDSRFKGMFTDPKFKADDYTVDKRGRPFQRSTNENLRDFYDLSSSDDDTPGTSSAQQENADGDEEIRIDLARGVGNVSTSESENSEWELESDDELVSGDWTQLDADAPRTEEITRRLAVCNMDWQRIRVTDLYMVFNSFKPADGLVESVNIYLSDFGSQRLADEQKYGPAELRDDVDNPDENYDVVKGSTKWRQRVAKIRQYEINRLRYYYAVVNCDSAETANAIYTACDGMEYLSSSIKMDLRFIPDSMTFDESLVKWSTTAAECDQNYKPVTFQTTTLSQTGVKLSWDDDDIHRKRKFENVFKEELLKAEDNFNDLLASGSSESEKSDDVSVEEKEEEEAEETSVSTDDAKLKQSRTERYRQLLKSLEMEEEKKRKRVASSEDDCDLEVTFEPALQDKAEEAKRQKQDLTDNLTPWQKYLQKRKEKRRHRVLERKHERDRIQAIRYESESDGDEQGDAEKNEEQLELLLDDGQGAGHHYNLKTLIKDARSTTGSRRKAREGADAAQVDDFRMNLHDSRFDAVYTSHLYNIDPSNASYKKTKGMEELLQEKRRRVKSRGDTKPTSTSRV